MPYREGRSKEGKRLVLVGSCRLTAKQKLVSSVRSSRSFRLLGAWVGDEFDFL